MKPAANVPRMQTCVWSETLKKQMYNAMAMDSTHTLYINECSSP